MTVIRQRLEFFSDFLSFIVHCLHFFARMYFCLLFFNFFHIFHVHTFQTSFCKSFLFPKLFIHPPFLLSLHLYFHLLLDMPADGSISIGRPDYSKSSSTTTSSSTSSDGSKSKKGVEIESIENIISDNEDDISVSSKSSSAMFSTSSTTSSNTSSKPKKDKAFNQANFYFSASTKNARHSKRVTGAKILKGPKPKLVSCGLDKKLICTDLETGDIKYSTVLDGVPLCMSVDVTDGYIVLGFLDGKVQFFSSRSGTKIMEIKAHNQKVL